MSKTPMMRQYDEAKKACGDALLFFRMGDFYELFHEDAKTAAKILGLTLTSRDKSNSVPMAGFPYHQLDSYLGKLIKQGYRAAVCDQVEDPKTAKGLVKREISQIVSPGTITDQGTIGAVGGLQLKILAAYHHDFQRVFIPSVYDERDGDWQTPFLMQVSPVATVQEAYQGLTGHQLHDTP